MTVGAGRRRYRYWVRDPLAGARLYAAHQAMRALPTDLVSAIGARLGPIAAATLHRAADARARAALRALRPDLVPDGAAMEAAMARVWDAQGRVYAEFSTEDRLWEEGRIAVEGREHLAAASSGGRPVIVAGLHLGNWEAVPISFGWLGHRFVQVYQPPRNRFENRIALHTRLRVNARMTAAGTGSFRLVPPSAGAGAAMLRGARERASFMIFVDEHHRGRVQAPSFGRPLCTDGNLARVIRLASLTGAAIIPAYAVRHGGARFTVRYLPPVTLHATGNREGDLLTNVAALDAVIAGPVLRHIEQWFMLPDYTTGA